MDICVKENQAIVIGRIGENERIRVIFDVSDLIGELGTDISFTLLHQKPGEDTAYPVPTAVFDGDELIWTVTAADTSAQGRGRCELICTVGDVVAKTVIWSTVIQTALDGSGEVPDVWESWQEVFSGIKADAETAAESAGASSEAATIAASNAENYASSAYHDKEAAAASASMASTYADAAQSSADDAAEWRDSAEMAADAAEAARDAAVDAAGRIIGLTATAETLPEGSTATASYDSTSGTLTLGIPTGATGAQGPKGDTGETGPQGIQGETGPAGAPGYSPRAAVTQTPDGAVIEITDTTGTTSATLTDGKIWDNLDAETDSYTPQVVVPCDDSGTVLSGVVTKRGRMLYINGAIPSNLRICIYGAFKGTRSVPSYANFPEWYCEPFDGFVVGHTYRYVPEIISGTVEATGGNDLLVLRQKDDTYKSITAGSTIVCETLPEAIFVMPRTGTYTDVKLYLHIVDVTASPVTDVQVNGSSVVAGGVASIEMPVSRSWELIREDTVINATEADIIISADSNGQSFELTDVRLVLVSPQQDTAFSKADYGRVRCYYQTGGYDIIFIGAYTQAANASAKVSYISFEQQDGMLTKVAMPNTSRGGMGPWQTYSTEDGEGCFVLPDTQRLYSRINITKVTGTLHYILYGRRK